MPGHVFVIPGDLRRLACDGWLLPTDVGGSIARGWLGWPPGTKAAHEAQRIGKVNLRSHRVKRIEEWGDDRPPLYLGNLFGEERGIERFVTCATAFVAEAGAYAQTHRFVPHRSCPLLGLPLVGSRFGGGARVAGEILERLLPELRRAARDAAVDVALVVYEEAAYAAAQAHRRKHAAQFWPELAPHSAAIERLVQLARDERLVVFFGSGASVGAGLPTWDDLLDQLARDAGLGADLAALRRLSVLDRARLVERAFDRKTIERPGERPMATRIAELFSSPYASLVHHLTAALPVREFVTTNFDDLFEVAAEGFHPALSVLPHAADPNARRWLLKMHGCVTRPQHIVLTRDDYLRYEQQRAALAGIVQALLLTRHMLFVGFSLADDNFHRIVDAVRRALSPGAQRAQFGTVLTLAHDRLAEDLWTGELEFVAMDGAYVDGVDAASFPVERSRRARTLEIFLDALAARSASAGAYLLRDDYAGTRGRDEQVLADELTALLERVPAPVRDTEAWSEVRKMYARLGLGPQHDPRDRDLATARRRKAP